MGEHGPYPHEAYGRILTQRRCSVRGVFELSCEARSSLEINNNEIPSKTPNIQKLNNIFLKNPWVKEEVTREIRNYCKLNENENATYQNLWHAAKAVPQRGMLVLDYINREMLILEQRKGLK